MPRVLGRIEAVTHAAYALQVNRHGAELLAQPADLRIDGPGRAGRMVSVNAIKYLLSGEGLAGVA
jgi:hypothetical protein